MLWLTQLVGRPIAEIPLNLQEQPLPMRIVVRLVLKVAPYGISLSKNRCLPPYLLKTCHELEMGI